MAEMTIKAYLIGFAVFIALITGGIYIVNDFQASEPALLDDSTQFEGFKASFDKAQELNQKVNATYEELRTSTTDPGTFTVLGGLYNIVWQSLKNMYISFGFVLDFMLSTTQIFGIPVWVYTLIVTVVLITFIFGIIYAVTNRGDL